MATAASEQQRYRHCILVSNLASFITCTENMSLIKELFQVSNPLVNDDFSFSYKLESYLSFTLIQ
jgi:hypothetical protein